MKLDGKVAWVVGGSSGIGAAVARYGVTARQYLERPRDAFEMIEKI